MVEQKTALTCRQAQDETLQLFRKYRFESLLIVPKTVATTRNNTTLSPCLRHVDVCRQVIYWILWAASQSRMYAGLTLADCTKDALHGSSYRCQCCEAKRYYSSSNVCGRTAWLPGYWEDAATRSLMTMAHAASTRWTTVCEIQICISEAVAEPGDADSCPAVRDRDVSEAREEWGRGQRCRINYTNTVGYMSACAPT